MTEQEKVLIESCCISLVNRFAVYNDTKRYKELADLFSEDARFARPTDPENHIVGRDNILEAFLGRPQGRMTRHVISNIVIDVIDQERASGICYAVLYTGDPNDTAEKFGVCASPQQFVGEFADEFILTPSGWRISQRSGKIIFTVG